MKNMRIQLKNFLADDPFKVLTVDTGTNDTGTNDTGTDTESNGNSTDTTDIVSILVLIY